MKSLQERANLVAEYNRSGQTVTEFARQAGIPRSTFREWLANPVAPVLLPDEPVPLEEQIRRLKTEMRSMKADQLDAEFVKRVIFKLADAPADPPKWLTKGHYSKSTAGVPTLFLSDLHWGEVVDPNQINGVNEYSLEIAHRRLQTVVEKTIHLCRSIVRNDGYPGIVLALGGDMISGDIHEELSATNEKDIMPIVLDLWGALIKAIQVLVDEFGHVFVPCVTGNHGRNTKKPRAKGRNFTNFDWLVYQMLAKYFEDDDRVSFLIPDGPDAYYRVYNHRFLLTHGDQFRGGDGMIGALGPIIRGDHKKRSRAGQIDMAYDTMIMGHWHQLIMLQRLIVNGSLKGYDEYANQCNFGFERPQQALWLTHPEHGITINMPVHADRPAIAEATDWVSVKRAA